MQRHEFEENDVEEILKRAIQLDRFKEDENDTLTRAAAELGVSPEALQAAKEQWLQEKKARADMAGFMLERKRDFYTHLGIFVIINAFLFVLNLLTNVSDKHPEFWVQYVLVSWGLGLAAHAFVTFFKGSGFTGEFENWKEKQQKELPKP